MTEKYKLRLQHCENVTREILRKAQVGVDTERHSELRTLFIEAMMDWGNEQFNEGAAWESEKKTRSVFGGGR